ncbi:hypothetical protein TELCIR_11627 [Teladorsagia circumcincta]|uniref:Uncharacterized protein n=1 Tax=Teladorsagia circumcincta TaxID=45464 RepID=A0A2G9UAX0_TELCI|nr:hypothetical protein TELCIR_11627 [Teladorsagia circumcincta]
MHCNRPGDIDDKGARTIRENSHGTIFYVDHVPLFGERQRGTVERGRRRRRRCMRMWRKADSTPQMIRRPPSSSTAAKKWHI